MYWLQVILMVTIGLTGAQTPSPGEDQIFLGKNEIELKLHPCVMLLHFILCAPCRGGPFIRRLL